MMHTTHHHFDKSHFTTWACLKLFILLSIFQQSFSFEANAQSKPNIVFIFADDHDQMTISAYGNALLQTPNIDRIAKEGVVFKNSFCTNSICAPSRAVILTGKHSHINGHKDNRPQTRFDSSQVTFPKLLQKAGYTTALVGKWHLRSNPTGFDYWDIHDDQGQYYNPDFISVQGKRQLKGYSTDITTDLALNWLEKNKNSQKPFLLMVQNKAPHTPFYPHTKYLGLFDSITVPEPNSLFDDYSQSITTLRDQEMTILEHMGPVGELKVERSVAKFYKIPGEGIHRDMYYDTVETGRMDKADRLVWEKERMKRSIDYMTKNPKARNEIISWKYQQYIKDYMRCVVSVDENVGRLLDYLENNGLSKNTIIVYSSDQGFWLGQRGWFDKRWMYEQSMRMPLIIKWPGITKARFSETLVQNLDYAPTFLEMAGINIPAEIQGKSLVSILKNDKVKLNRDALFYQYFEYPQPHRVQPHYGIRTERYKLIYFNGLNQYELYDLKTDPSEINNLAANDAYSALLKEMKAKLEIEKKRYKVVE